MVVQKHWENISEFYERLISKDPAFTSLLALVKQIAGSDYANQLYPVTSHYNLCISTSDDYIESQKLPMITVQNLDNHNLRIKFWENPKRIHKLKTYTCNLDDSWPLLKQLFAQLIL